MSRGPLERWRDPQELLRHLGVDHPRELDLDAIAEYCGATVLYRPMRGCAARLVSRGERAIIMANSSMHPFRQRFSIAHELAHWIFDRGKLDSGTFHQGGFDRRAFYCDIDAERRRKFDHFRFKPRNESDVSAYFRYHEERDAERHADRWAADLLMPESMFRTDAAGRDATFATVRDLARRYRTSLTATAIRLVDHGPLPSLLVCCRRGEGWRWRWYGPGVPDRLWPWEEPRRGTAAYALLSGRPGPGPLEVPADLWMKRQGSWWYTLREDSVRVRDGEVLSLLSWPDPAQLEHFKIPRVGWLPWSPGRNARQRLAKCLCDRWGYRRVRGAVGEITLETGEPTHQRLVAPRVEALDGDVLRGLVDAVARHKRVRRGEVLRSMLVDLAG